MRSETQALCWPPDRQGRKRRSGDRLEQSLAYSDFPRMVKWRAEASSCSGLASAWFNAFGVHPLSPAKVRL